MLTALFAYTSGEDTPELDGMTSMCFEFIRASIDAYSEKYDAKCQQNRENGKRGGRPKTADAEMENQSETTETERKAKKPNGLTGNRTKSKKANGSKKTMILILILILILMVI